MLLIAIGGALRQAQRQRPRRWGGGLRVLAKCLVGLVLCATLVEGGNTVYKLVRDARYFRLRRVQIVGNKMLSRSDILYLLALPPRVTLLQLDLARMGSRLERHPEVKAVVLRRRFPDTLRIVVQERSPCLVVASTWQRMVLDTEGIVLRPFAPNQDNQLPQLTLQRRYGLAPGMRLQQAEVRRALELVRSYRDSPLASMMHLVSLTVEHSGASVWHVEPYTFAIRLGEGKVERQLQRLPPVLRYIEQRKLAVRLVDVSYRKHVVVTLSTS